MKINPPTIYKTQWQGLMGSTGFPWITEPSTDTQYRITETSTEIYIDFQACHSRKDWIMTLFFWKKRINGLNLKGHAGFVTKFNSVINDISVYIMSKRKNIVIRGYSKGSALATLLHIWLCERHYRPVTYVFAPPRVVNIRDTRYVFTAHTSLFHRIVNNGDLVTLLPPRWLGYKSFGLSYVLNSGVFRLPLPRYHADKWYNEMLGNFESREFGEGYSERNS